MAFSLVQCNALVLKKKRKCENNFPLVEKKRTFYNLRTIEIKDFCYPPFLILSLNCITDIISLFINRKVGISIVGIYCDYK